MKLTSEELAKQADRAIRTAIENAGKSAEIIAQKAILDVTRERLIELTGISVDTWQRVYSFNRQDKTPIGRQVATTVEQRAAELLAQIAVPVVLTEKEVAKFQRAYLKAYREALAEEITRQAEKLAAEMAAKDAMVLVAQIGLDGLQFVQGEIRAAQEGK